MSEEDGFEQEEYREDAGEPARQGGERRYGSIKPNYFLPKPVKVGDVVDVEVQTLTKRGEGLAKKDGFVIFIKGAQQGDKLKVRISEVKARYATGEIVQ
ncbi:MAG: TRAM domain-containing protein [Candidatus Marsarchaeota archaeon]|jgi:predicted RNA-binding protein with TRAM domain|nr:TRAM domain-containing protein [Candidatus Marsarchaeota archaeon]MCL5430879.1 TRAM domain-containing protein [Candidatus Marsarchaeota archaeon]